MPTSKVKGLDEQQLEGGISGAGGSGGKSDVSSWSSVKQFEKLSPTAEKAQAKIDKVNSEQKSSRSYKPTENTVLGKRELSYYELSDAQRAALTPRQRKQLGGDMDTFAREYKTGGAVTASRRADGIAMRGKTRGKMC